MNPEISNIPLVIGPEDLTAVMSAAEQPLQKGKTVSHMPRVVDLRPTEAYQLGHIPGAVNVSAQMLNKSEKPQAGLLPDQQTVNELLAIIGANEGDHIVACDGGVSTEAARMIWVLHAYGINHCSWLNGGYQAWQAAGLPSDVGVVTVEPGSLKANWVGNNVIDVEALLQQISDPDTRPFDNRSAEEFLGTDVRSQHGGHMPGAAHWEWKELFDDSGMLLADDALRTQFAALELRPDQLIVPYCQSHQRSAVSYIVLKHLGYQNVRALNGAWSTWGNRDDTPKER